MSIVNQIWNFIFIVNWERFSPISLAAKNGIPQAVIYFSFSNTLCFNCGNGFFNCHFGFQTIQKIRICYNGILFCVSCFRNRNSCKNIFDFQVEMFCEIKIALVSTRNRHYSSRSVGSQNIITNPNLNFFTIKRMNCKRAGKLSGNIFHIRLAVAFRFYGSIFFVFSNSISKLGSCNFIHQRMFWR